MAPCQRSHSPSHLQRNGIRSSHEGSPSPTTLDPRFWQRMQTPVPGHSRHPRNRHMFLHHVEKHPRGQKYHLRKNSLLLQTTQARKRTRLAHRRRRHTRLLRRCRHFNSRYHNIQNPNQQHALHGRRRHDDDEHQNYYLGTPLPRFEYMKMLLSRFPEEIIQKYNLSALAVDGWVYIEIRKGMYGLKQSGLLANQLHQARLIPFGYYPARHTPGLWLHKTCPISFRLVVDDFAVKYVGKHHAEHLRKALLRTYELTTNWMATVYSGMTLKWDYNKCTCNMSMPGYVSNVLSKLQHYSPKQPQHTPSRYVTPVYGAKTQYTNTTAHCTTMSHNPKSHRIRCVLCQSS
jgi:hypothetical protein